MGNSVIYEDGGFGFDLDSRELIPIDMLKMLGEYKYTIEEYAEGTKNKIITGEFKIGD